MRQAISKKSSGRLNSMIHRGFKPQKCQTSLKLALSRIKLMRNKKAAQVNQLKKEVSQLLENNQDQTAMIRVEHVIREENFMATYDLIEVYCQLIVARMQIIDTQKNCPIDLKEAISSVIFASQRCDIDELSEARKQFQAKYGKDFVVSALELRPNSGVIPLIVEKLSAKAPDVKTKIKVLTSIANDYGIKWESQSFKEPSQKANEGLLRGSSFESSNKLAGETINHEFISESSPKQQPVKKSTFSEVSNPVKVSESFSVHDTIATPRQSLSKQRTPEWRHEEWPTNNQPFNGDEINYGIQPGFRMDFKDAASAAQAAAESAEMASMAARAAAELASQENFSGQNSTNAHDDGFSESSELESDVFVHETVPISQSTRKKDTPHWNSENKDQYIDEAIQSNRRQNSISSVSLPHFDDDGAYNDDHVDYDNFTYDRGYMESQKSDVFNQERVPISLNTGEKDAHEVNSLHSGIKDHYADGTMQSNSRQSSISELSLPHFDDDSTYNGDQLDFGIIANERENLETQESQFISKSNSSSSSNEDAKIAKKHSDILNAEYDTDPEGSEDTCADLQIGETYSGRFPSKQKIEKLDHLDNESEHILWTKPLSGGLRNRVLPFTSHTRSELYPESTEKHNTFSPQLNLHNQSPSKYPNYSAYSESYSNSFEGGEDKSDWNQTRSAKGSIESNRTSSVGSDLIKKDKRTNYSLIPDDSEIEKGKSVTSQAYKLSHSNDTHDTNRTSSVMGSDPGIKNTGYDAKLMSGSFGGEDGKLDEDKEYLRSQAKDSVHSNQTSSTFYFSRNNASLMLNESTDSQPSKAKGSPILKQHRKGTSVSSRLEAPYQDQCSDDSGKTGNNIVNVNHSRRTRSTSTQSKSPENSQLSEIDKFEIHEDTINRPESSNIRFSNLQTQKGMKGSPSPSGSTSPKRRGMFGRPTSLLLNENSVSECSDDSEAPQIDADHIPYLGGKDRQKYSSSMSNESSKNVKVDLKASQNYVDCIDADRIPYLGKKDRQKYSSSTPNESSKNVKVDPKASQNYPEWVASPKGKESPKSTEGSQSSKHIHPKLPDSDNLISYFQSLRADRRK